MNFPFCTRRAFLIDNNSSRPPDLYFCNHLVTVEGSFAKHFPISCCSKTSPLFIHHSICSFSFWLPALAVCRRFLSSSSLSAISILKGRLMVILIYRVCFLYYMQLHIKLV